MNDNALPVPVDPAEFRRVVGRFATGVTIVSTVVDGVDHAMTVNAFTSVSLEPLLVLFCAEKIARFHDAVLRSGQWAVSVLPENAQELSTWFATRGRPLGDGRLSEPPFKRGPMTGAPILTEAVATLECRTHAVHEGGDHSIIVGEVLAVDTPDLDARPLLFYEGRYRTVE
ncbi:flavin reductase family protein [Thermomonospora catenispora]|uniref:flavin reductase family protein n=1 Tax=Thermomonospora catenispora TaxID=2493090 RepID=UPI001F4F168B|nr:flavin reductase family protein [Thermomonospora catenispora]